MKKILVLVLALVLTATAAIGSTAAWLTSKDQEVNVMTLGKVKIKQHEYQRAEGVAYNAGEAGAGNGIKEGDLVPFEQGQGLFPAVPNGDLPYTAEPTDLFYWGDYVYSGTAGNGLWNDNKLANVMDKMVFVENTGRSSAYVRTVIAFECPEGMEYSEGPDKQFMMNINGSALYEWDEAGYISIDGSRYLVMSATYLNALAPGQTAHPSLLQVVMTHNAANEDMEKLGETYEIHVLSQAVQTEGFADAPSALNTAFGEVNTVTAAEWFGSTEALIDAPYAQYINNTEPYTVDGFGKTILGVVSSADEFTWTGGTLPDMSTVFSSENGAKATVQNITFTGTMSAVCAGQYVDSSSNWFNTEFNNVNIIDAEVVSFSAGISPALVVYGTMVMNDCEVSGTTLSHLDTDPMWPAYDMAVVNYSDTTINDSKIGSLYMWNQAKVTVADGTKVDRIVIRGNMNTTKYGLVIQAGAKVGVIDLSNIETSTRVNITIEEGATVGAFVDNGIEYATIDAWKAAQ